MESKSNFGRGPPRAHIQRHHVSSGRQDHAHLLRVQNCVKQRWPFPHLRFAMAEAPPSENMAEVEASVRKPSRMERAHITVYGGTCARGVICTRSDAPIAHRCARLVHQIVRMCTRPVPQSVARP